MEDSIANRKPKRMTQLPKRYEHSNLIAYALNVELAPSEGEPRSFEEAVHSKDSRKWIEAMQEEMRSSLWLKDNNS